MHSSCLTVFETVSGRPMGVSAGSTGGSGRVSQMSQFFTAAVDALGNADTELGNAIRG